MERQNIVFDKSENEVGPAIGLDLSREAVADVKALVDKAITFKVANPDDEERGITLGKELRGAVEALNAREDELIAEPRERVKLVQGWSRPIRRSLEGAIDTLKGAILAHRRKIQEEQRKIQEEAERKRKLLEKKAEKKGEVFVPPTPPPEVPKTTQTQSGAAGTYRMVKRWRVTDEKKIPREYWLIDEKKMNAVVRAGAIVPGIEVYEEPDLAIR